MHKNSLNKRDDKVWFEIVKIVREERNTISDKPSDNAFLDDDDVLWEIEFHSGVWTMDRLAHSGHLKASITCERMINKVWDVMINKVWDVRFYVNKEFSHGNIASVGFGQTKDEVHFSSSRSESAHNAYIRRLFYYAYTKSFYDKQEQNIRDDYNEIFGTKGGRHQ